MLPFEQNEDEEMRFFGPKPWGRLKRTGTPVGEPCCICKKPMTALDYGVTTIAHRAEGQSGREASHRDCFFAALGMSRCVVDRLAEIADHP